MEHLLGLQGAPSQDAGFVYSHPDSGFVFELRLAPATAASDSSDADDDAAEAEELEYRPLQLGSASEVQPSIHRLGQYAHALVGLVTWRMAVHQRSPMDVHKVQLVQWDWSVLDTIQ